MVIVENACEKKVSGLALVAIGKGAEAILQTVAEA